MNQQQLEETYSRRSIRQHVMADIDIDSDVYLRCTDAIYHYMDQKYYQSKDVRIKKLKEMEDCDIVTELFIAVLPIQEISPFQSVATQLGNRLGFSHILDGVKTAGEILAVCELSGLYTIYHSSNHENDTGTLGIKAHYSLNESVQDFISKTMYLPPMVEPPKDWTTNADGGYLNGSGSVLLGAINHHNEEQCLDIINTIQQIPWELNEFMVNFEETPNKPLDTHDKREQFSLMKNQSTQVYQQMMDLGNKFYFTWKNDKRGRMNCQGYHINLHSTQYKKSILQFANKEVLT